MSAIQTLEETKNAASLAKTIRATTEQVSSLDESTIRVLQCIIRLHSVLTSMKLPSFTGQ